MLNLFKLLVGFIGLEHVLFGILEGFLWQTDFGMRLFRLTEAKAEASYVLAMNQGLYNGFLAAGLFWSLFLGDSMMTRQVQFFFLLCVSIAGIFGGVTATKSIFWVQAVPGLIALTLYFFLPPS